MKRLIKLVILFLILNTANIGLTNSYFTAKASIEGNLVSTGCWVAPSVPVLLSPADGLPLSTNDQIISWQPSIPNCSLAEVSYDYQVLLNGLPYQANTISGTSVNLISLPEGSYSWKVQAKNQFGNNSGFSIEWTFRIDRTAPTISNLNYFIGTPGESNELKATIKWTTNEPATSNLEWRTSLSDPWTALPLDLTADQTDHQREIPGLIADTTYYFLVRSSDAVGNENTAEGSFETNSERWGVLLSNIVINEYLPNPIGSDDALQPGGEWVEIYNRGSLTVNLTDWYLTDSYSSHRLSITLVNTFSSNPLTTGLDLAPGEFLVVYRNGDSDFSLNNTVGDSVILRKPDGWWADIHIYSVILGDEVLENKSFARFPDGTDNWFDPIPSPGGPNVLEEISAPTAVPTPAVEFSLREDRHAVSFTATNLGGYTQISYTIDYDAQPEAQQIAGTIALTGDNFSRENLLLGTCSEVEGKVCVYDWGMAKITLKIVLTKSDGTTLEIIKEITY